MIYLFEDNKRVGLSQLFLAGYTDRQSIKKFVLSKYTNLQISGENGIEYVNGNVEIERRMQKLESTLDETENIGIFLDLVPGNRNLENIYNKLIHYYNIGKPVYTVPIVCAEYYFIRSIYGTDLIEDNLLIKHILNRNIHYTMPDMPEIDQKTKRKIFDIEKECKLAIKTYGKDCLNIKTGIRDKEIDIEQFNRYFSNSYYTNGCPCDNGCGCTNSLLDKSYRLLRQYPCFPKGSIFSLDERYRVIGVNKKEYVRIHNRLIDNFNELVQKYIDYALSIDKPLLALTFHRLEHIN